MGEAVEQQRTGGSGGCQLFGERRRTGKRVGQGLEAMLWPIGMTAGVGVWCGCVKNMRVSGLWRRLLENREASE